VVRRQQRLARNKRDRHVCPYDSTPFSDHELICLSFVRWLYQTGRLDPREYNIH
jgi:hypothetical protein